MQWKKNQIYSQVNRMFQEEFFVIEIVYIFYLFMINVIFIFSLNLYLVFNKQQLNSLTHYQFILFIRIMFISEKAGIFYFCL